MVVTRADGRIVWIIDHVDTVVGAPGWPVRRVGFAVCYEKVPK